MNAACAVQLNGFTIYSDQSLSDVVRPSFEANEGKIAGGCARRTTTNQCRALAARCHHAIANWALLNQNSLLRAARGPLELLV